MDIEVDHLRQAADGGSNEIENAVPLCYDCHAKVHHYNDQHPRGTKYWIEELKVRRDQVFEEFTRHLVPPVNYFVTQELGGGQTRELPDIGFIFQHLGDALPVRAVVTLRVLMNGRQVGLPRGHYDGTKRWRLNPRMSVVGHFEIPRRVLRRVGRLEIHASVSIIDVYDRKHDLLPIGWVYLAEQNSWYLEP